MSTVEVRSSRDTKPDAKFPVGPQKVTVFATLSAFVKVSPVTVVNGRRNESSPKEIGLKHNLNKYMRPRKSRT